MDRDGTVVWENEAARTLTRGNVGRSYLRPFAPESHGSAERLFTRQVLGLQGPIDFEAVLLQANGTRTRAEISCVPIESGGQVLGIFGAAVLAHEAAAAPPPQH
jgi:PAS domain-containing protein